MQTQAIQNFHALQSQTNRPFVAPAFCKELLSAGLNSKALHSWKLSFSNEVFLFSDHFDPDGYYTAAENLLNSKFCKEVIPAYTSADMETLIGDFHHFYTNGVHEIIPIKHRRIGIRKSPRYPDALALVVIELLHRKIVTPEAAAESINK